MSTPQFTVDASAFDRAARALTSEGFEKQAGRTTAWAIKRMVILVRKNVRLALSGHRQTGKLRGGIRWRVRGAGIDAVGGVKTTGSVSNLIVGGVTSHEIAPGRVMPLWAGTGAFRGGRGAGITGFARVVQHPGFAADPFFSRGVQRSEGEMAVIIRKSTETMAKELAYRMSRGG